MRPQETIWAGMVVAVFVIVATALSLHGFAERATNLELKALDVDLKILDVCESYFYGGGSHETCPKDIKEYLGDEEGES